MEYVHEDKDIHTRRFFSSLELYSLFEKYYIEKTNKNDITVKGITTNINEIIKLNSYPYLKRLQMNTRKEKINKYIFLDKNEDLDIDLQDLKFNKRQARYNTYVASRAYATPQSDITPTCPQAQDATPPSIDATPLSVVKVTPQVATRPQVATHPHNQEESNKRQKVIHHQFTSSVEPF